MLTHLQQWLFRRRLRWLAPLFLIGIGAVLAIAVSYLPSASQGIRRAQIVEILNTPNTFRVLIDQNPAQITSEANLGQNIATERDARTAVQLSNQAVIRLGKNALFTVGKQCVQHQRGQVLVSNVPGCIGSVIATNLGTIYTLEELPGVQGEIRVLRGKVRITSLTDAKVQPVMVNQAEKVVILSTGEPGSVVPITLQEYDSILRGELFQGFQIPVPGQEQLAAVRQQLLAAIPAPRLSPSPPSQAPVGSAIAPSKPIVSSGSSEFVSPSEAAPSQSIAPSWQPSQPSGQRQAVRTPQTPRIPRRSNLPVVPETPVYIPPQRLPDFSSQPPAYVPPAVELPPPALPPVPDKPAQPVGQPSIEIRIQRKIDDFYRNLDQEVSRDRGDRPRKQGIHLPVEQMTDFLQDISHPKDIQSPSDQRPD